MNKMGEIENMKYKVGDRVRIKSIDWYNKNKDEYGAIDCGYHMFTKEMSKFCGCTMIVCKRTNLGVMTMGGSASYWTDEMIDGFVGEEIIDIDDFQDDNEMGDIIDECVHRLKDNECFMVLPEGYIFKDEDGNVINTTKIVLEKKKKEYPKTYGECCGVLGYSGNYNITVTTDVDNKSFNALYKLKVCRDAYWKLYGKEIGLRKPWEPDFRGVTTSYVITVECNKILKSWTTKKQVILAFPTAEMRDVFYENFKELIEQCKELL